MFYIIDVPDNNIASELMMYDDDTTLQNYIERP